jgi:hypothetical protein
MAMCILGGMAGHGALDEQSDEQLVCAILADVMPLECDVVGPQAVADVASGMQFQEFDGGRHLTLSDTLALISAVAAVVQCVLAFRPSLQVNVSIPDASVDAERIATAIRELAARDPSVDALMRDNLDLTMRLKRVLASRGLPFPRTLSASTDEVG